MKSGLKLAGNFAAVAGVAICLIAGAARLTGRYHLAGFEAMTLFNGGIGLMLAACLAKLHLLEKN